MITEIDLLREDIPRLEKKFGRDNPFVELLRAQLDFLQNQTVHQPLREQRHMGVVNFIKSRIQKRKKASSE
jgi:hypothetical protein